MWILTGVMWYSYRQEALQHQAVEDLHRLLQLPPGGRNRGREDLLLSWRYGHQSQSSVPGPTIYIPIHTEHYCY